MRILAELQCTADDPSIRKATLSAKGKLFNPLTTLTRAALIIHCAQVTAERHAARPCQDKECSICALGRALAGV